MKLFPIFLKRSVQETTPYQTGTGSSPKRSNDAIGQGPEAISSRNAGPSEISAIIPCPASPHSNSPVNRQKIKGLHEVVAEPASMPTSQTSERAGNVVLQDRDSMLKRLCEVDDDDHFLDNFYPILLKSAGQERSAMGVANMVLFAIYEYTKSKPPIFASLMQRRAKDFIKALVPHDSEICRQAEEMCRQAEEFF